LEIFGIILFAVGIFFILIRLPLPINIELGVIKSAWFIGPIFILVGGLLWWAF
jgi:hypothetical protein